MFSRRKQVSRREKGRKQITRRARGKKKGKEEKLPKQSFSKIGGAVLKRKWSSYRKIT